MAIFYVYPGPPNSAWQSANLPRKPWESDEAVLFTSQMLVSSVKALKKINFTLINNKLLFIYDLIVKNNV